MTIDYLGHVRADAAAMAEAAGLGLGPQCPSCPEWTVRQLLEHTGTVHRWVTEIVRRRATERVKRQELAPPPEADADIVPWFQEGAEGLIEMLATTPLDEHAWNWSSSQPHQVRFWPRRMAHETAVHRWDAQRAHGAAGPIDAELAVDGIEEMLDTVLTTNLAYNPGTPSLGGTLHLHCTDVEGEWLVEVADNDVTVRREHAKGDVALRGSASDLLLSIYGRSDEGVERFGDESVFATWLEISRF